MGLAEGFRQEVWSTLTVEPILDGKVIAIKVPSYPADVISTDGQTWFRFGSECIKVDPRFRKRLEMIKRQSTQTDME